MKKTIIKILKFYKANSFLWASSPLFFPHGQCRFYPTCSEYAISVVEKYGTSKGLAKSFWRVLRCNPFSKGGADPA